MSAKPRSDSKLAALNPEQKAQLRTWLVDENKSYDEVRQLLHDDFNLEIGITAISRFYATDCFSLRSSQAKELAEQVVAELKTGGGQFDAATLALVRQKAFERAYAKNGDIEELAMLAKILGDSAKHELATKRLSLDLEKFRQTVKSEAEKGLDALHAELAGDPVALALFEQMRARVMKTLEAKS